MNSNSSENSATIWPTDTPLDKYALPFARVYQSMRIEGRYKIPRESELYLKYKLDGSNGYEQERYKARLATVLIKRISNGESIPVVDKILIDRVWRNARPMSVAKRVRRLLRYIAKTGPFINDPVYVFLHEPLNQAALGWSESISDEELKYLLNYLCEEELIEEVSPGNGGYFATVKGFAEIEHEIRASDSSKAFVALWFDDATKELSDTIEKAVSNSGYEAVQINKKDFVTLIDDEILASIRGAKFVVVDLSHGDDGMRGSVYFEAGFAMALGKKVVFTAREDHLSSDSNRKIAFDLNHYPIIPWSCNNLSGFSSKLSARIEGLFGKGPLSDTQTN